MADRDGADAQIDALYRKLVRLAKAGTTMESDHREILDRLRALRQAEAWRLREEVGAEFPSVSFKKAREEAEALLTRLTR